jgi:hypothetical protein
LLETFVTRSAACSPVTPIAKRKFPPSNKTSEQGNIDKLTSEQRKYLRREFDGMFPFRRFPTSTSISQGQGGQRFIAKLSSTVKSWDSEFSLADWVDGRVRNHTCNRKLL